MDFHIKLHGLSHQSPWTFTQKSVDIHIKVHGLLKEPCLHIDEVTAKSVKTSTGVTSTTPTNPDNPGGNGGGAQRWR